MTITLSDIPTVEQAGRFGRRPSADMAIATAYSATPSPAGNLLSSLGISAGLRVSEALGRRLYPNARDIVAFGAGPSYTMYGDCSAYNYNGTCNEACFGFEPHHMDPFYCATCGEQAADPVNNPAYNWHYVGSRGSIQYIDREPDVCLGKDAWKWKVGACGNCSSSAVFRCHDGYKRYPGDASWTPTICQGLVACDDQLTPC